MLSAHRRSNLSVTPPNVEFSDGEDSDKNESPVLEHPHMVMRGDGPSEVEVEGEANAGEAQGQANRHSTERQANANAGGTVGLPSSLVSSPSLAAQFRVSLFVRISALRLLVLDVDGAPIVPLDHLRTRMALGRGRRLTRDYAAETAARLLLRLERSLNLNHDADLDDSDDNDDQLDEHLDNWDDEVTLNQLPLCIHAEHASELGPLTASLPHRLVSHIPECPCSLCHPLAETSVFFKYLHQPQNDSNLDPALKQQQDSLDWVLHQQKMDYHKPDKRRLTVWEERFDVDSILSSPFTASAAATTTSCSNGKVHSRGIPACRQCRALRLNHPSPTPQQLLSHHQQLNQQQDQQEQIDDNQEDEEIDDSSDDNDSNDPHLLDSEDEESESCTEEEMEESFLDDYMIKLHELFGLLEVNAKLEEIIHHCR
ncbi:UNVERIFIED_CONTAM: hypothetical protein HDU68_007359 [Siphonaria sp. JEL0065]|nr:hypothetical protein HDU68_007359 [Siphonaria sp. JEL0065]